MASTASRAPTDSLTTERVASPSLWRRYQFCRCPEDHRFADISIIRYSVTAMVKPLLPERPMAPAVFQILIALADQPLHGYGIMLDVAERSAGRVKMSPGTLYGSIKHMLDDGLIEETEGRFTRAVDERRRYYRLTG